MKKSYNKAFTLVELLAVIVILAIILVIAVPKIMSVITDSKKASLETSVKMIASSAEKTKMQNIVLGKEDEDITCSSVAKLNSNDYDLDNCTITFDTNNNASVNINGKGKFSGLSVCGGTKTQATAQTEVCLNYTPSKYFTYGLYAVNSSDIIVEDVDKCINYIYTYYDSLVWCTTSYIEEHFCSNKKDLASHPMKEFGELGLKLNDNAEIGVVITDYNIEGGTEVIIPNTIDGYPVIGLQIYNEEITKLIVPDIIKEEYSYSYYYDSITDSWYYSGVLEEPDGCPPLS